MKKFKLGIVIAICLFAVIIIPNFYAAGNTIEVRPGNGTLNAAISGAQDGDTIKLVGDGRYTGDKIVLDKDIKIVGTSTSRNYVSNLFEINGASNVTFENLSLDAGAMITTQKNHNIIDVKAKTNVTINNVNISYATRTDSDGKFTADVKNIYLEKGSDGTVVNIKNSIVGGIYNAIIVESSNNTITAEKTDIGGNVAIALRNGRDNKVYIRNNSKLSGRSYFVANSEECISIVGQENLVMEISDSEIFGVAVADRIYTEDGELIPGNTPIPAHLISFEDEASNNVNIKITGNSKIEDDDKKGDSNIINFGDVITPDSDVSVFIENTVKIIPDTMDEKYNVSDDYAIVGIKNYKGDWTIKPYNKNTQIPIEEIPQDNVKGYKLDNVKYMTEKQEEATYYNEMQITENTDIISYYIKLLSIRIDGEEEEFYLEKNSNLGDLKKESSANIALENLKNPGDSKEFKNYVVSYTDENGDEHTDVVQENDDGYVFKGDSTISADYNHKVKVTLKVDNVERITTYLNQGQSLNELSLEDKAKFEEALKSDTKRVKGYVELVEDEEVEITSEQPITKDITIIAKYEVDVKVGEDQFTIDEGATLNSLKPEDMEKLNAHKNAENKDFKNFVKVVDGVESDVVDESTTINEHTTLVPKYTVKVTISGVEYTIDEGENLRSLLDFNMEANDAVLALKNVEGKIFAGYIDAEGKTINEMDKITKHVELSPVYNVKVTISDETFILKENDSLSDLQEQDKQKLDALKTERFSRFVDEDGNTFDEEKAVSKNTVLTIKNNVNITIGEEVFTLEEGCKLTNLTPENIKRLETIKNDHELNEVFVGFKNKLNNEMVNEDVTTFDVDTELEAVYEIIKGDLDKNGEVDTADAARALNLFKYKNFTEEDIAIGDMDGNGIIDTADAAEILNVFKYGNNK